MTMATMPAQRGAPAQAPGPAPMPAVPFADGSYEYSEIIATYLVTPGAAAQDLPVTNITPGGFLRGVSIIVTSTGGAQGDGVFSPDNPWSLFNYLTLESIDGTPMKYPMGGYSEYLVSRYGRPWDGDPALDPSFASGANPAFRLSYFIEGRATLGVVPNTDARAQYRLRANVNPLTSTNPAGGLYTSQTTATAPAVTVAVALETYAQPPRATLGGAPIVPVPDGIGMQRFTSHDIIGGLGTGSNTPRSTRVGNLIRTLILVFRSSTGVRTDLTADPIRLRVDTTQLFVENRNHRDYLMYKFFQQVTAPGVVGSTRPTGVYVFPRWQQPGDMKGQGWLETAESTFLQFEVIGAAAAGSLEIITEDYAPVAAVPAYLENI